MIIKILLAILVLLLPSIAQSQSSVSVSANYHNRSCIGGTGFCSSKETITESEKPNARLQKMSKNKVNLILGLKNFKVEEIAALRKEKSFNVSGEKNITLDREILNQLKIDPQFSELKSGDYPLEILEKEIVITFTLVKK
jgi:hypothetical protein